MCKKTQIEAEAKVRPYQSRHGVYRLAWKGHVHAAVSQAGLDLILRHKLLV